jgi:hypothetical protein
LVKAGYGSISQVKEMTAREVIQALNYESFLGDFEKAYLELNEK